MKISSATALAWMVMALTPSLFAESVKWEMNADSGRWSLAAKALSLENVVTSVEVDGAWIELGHGEASPPVKVHDALGDGERTEIKSTTKGVELSLGIMLYKAGSRTLVEATLRNVREKPQVITEFRAFRGKVSTKDAAAQCRFFKNSGSQGTSGVFPIGTGAGQQSAYIGCLYDPAAKSSLGLGMVSYHRADATISTRATGEHELEVTGSAYFTRVPIQPGQTLSSEAYLLEWSPAPLDVFKEPLLPLGAPGEFDAGITGSVCVLQTAPEKYQMWYSAGERYQDIEGVHRGIVHIGHADSKDGVEWTKTPRPVLSPRLDAVTPFEAVVSKPCVLLIDGTYHMWFSVYSMSGKGYRLSYARSKGGVTWERFADEEILPLKPKGFETKTQFYPNVIEMGDELWMFYAANVPSGTGIGLATMPKSDLAPAP